MIGVCRETGRTLTGFEQFLSRFRQAVTTPLGSRKKRRGVGSKLPKLQGKNMGDGLIALAQFYTIETFLNAENGLTDFEPKQVIATRRPDGLTLSVSGLWNGQSITFEETL